MLPPHFRKVRAGFTLKLLALGTLKHEEEGENESRSHMSSLGCFQFVHERMFTCWRLR
jgi:hypothetical protein